MPKKFYVRKLIESSLPGKPFITAYAVQLKNGCIAAEFIPSECTGITTKQAKNMAKGLCAVLNIGSKNSKLLTPQAHLHYAAGSTTAGGPSQPNRSKKLILLHFQKN